ncbi:hypothetical protein O5255_26510 [Escherichia coli]|nr:hypothetical protein [Escherichia coli]
MHPRMILLFSSIKWGDQVSKDILHVVQRLNKHDGESITDNAANIDFIYFLLSHGYLSTDYMAYRSSLYAGSLSTEDNNFIRAVTSGRLPDETAKCSSAILLTQ